MTRPGESADTDRTAHSTTQSLGLGLITAALLTVVVLTLILFDGEDIAVCAVPFRSSPGRCCWPV